MKRPSRTLALAAGLFLTASLAMSPAAAGAAPGSATRTVSPNATTAQIINANSDKCLEVYNSSKSNGAKVDQWTCNNTATQNWHWVLVDSADGAYEIINNNSGKCLEVYHSDTGNGAKVDQWTCNGTDTQKWEIWVNDSNGMLIANRNADAVLEVNQSSKSNGAQVDVWISNGTKTQRWFRGQVV